MADAQNGCLLYDCSGDTAPGDMNGQELEGLWFPVSAAGMAIQ